LIEVKGEVSASGMAQGGRVSAMFGIIERDVTKPNHFTCDLPKEKM
jgi:hypothetical protein